MIDVDEQRRRLDETRRRLTDAIRPFPSVAVIAGTGLGDVVGGTDVKAVLPYESIPNFPESTVPGHEGRLVWGAVEGCDAIVFQGRFHLYEGYSPWEVTFPLRAAIGCGLKALIITNASGGLNPEFASGDVMAITDHINMTGENPLVGPNAPEWGDRFPDMTGVYDPELRAMALAEAAAAGQVLRQGVYIQVKGPSLETPAETRFFRMIGADAIGMSTVQEAIVAVQGGVRTLGLSVVTNMNLPDNMAPASLEQILETAESAAPRLSVLIHRVLARWAEMERE